MCSPDNSQLYNEDFYKDMNEENKCKKLNHESIKVTKLLMNINGIELKFAYNGDKKNGFNFYKYDDVVKGYIPINRSSEYFSILYDKVS